jgi:hypothetical protein
MSEHQDIIDRLRSGLQTLGPIKRVDDVIRVTTHCMYPSNGLVTVTVRAGLHSARVSDEGAAFSEAVSAGITTFPADKYASRIIADHGVKLERGVLYSPSVPLDAVPATILVVANASKEIAEWLYRNAKFKVERDFKAALTKLLHTTFDDKVQKKVVAGKRAEHSFAHVVSLDAKTIIIDPVLQDASSISTRVLSHLDVKQREDHNIIQRIVYDDYEPWTSDNLALLGMSEVPLVAFSKTNNAIQRLLAA